jgi:hypothetical protein
MDDEEVLAAAEALRPLLGGLAGGDAAELGARLDELIRRAGTGQSVKVPLLSLLAGNPVTREWMRQALEVPREYRTFQPQAGRTDIAGVLYACPRCGRQWYRFSVLDPIPVCENDEIPYEQPDKP